MSRELGARLAAASSFPAVSSFPALLAAGPDGPASAPRAATPAPAAAPDSAEPAEDLRGRLASLVRAADRLRARGHLAEAVSLYRDQALPLYETLDEPRDLAALLGKLADALEASGERGEALALRRFRILPILDALGDERAKAALAPKLQPASTAAAKSPTPHASTGAGSGLCAIGGGSAGGASGAPENVEVEAEGSGQA